MRLNTIEMRDALFGTVGKTVTSVIAGIVAGLFLFVLGRFILIRANWAIITENLRLFYLGTYPLGEEWRVWIPFVVLALVGGVSYGVYGGALRPFLRMLGVVAVLLLGLGWSFVPRFLNALTLGLAPRFGAGWFVTLFVIALGTGGAFLGRLGLRRLPQRSQVNLILGVSWAVPFLLAFLLNLRLSPNRWNGLFLDTMVFSIGGLLSFPIGVLLALGRNSSLISIRYVTTAYIEVVRAGPLVVWLILALFLWNDFFFETNKVYRGMLVFGFFGAAYVAEVVRGGLQSVPRGQMEASRSLGLSVAKSYLYVVLPQAIRAVIPALVGRFIALWKDTSLLIGLTLINTLEVATAILEGRPSNGQFLLEIYLVIALFYWLISFVLSRLGKSIEASLKL